MIIDRDVFIQRAVEFARDRMLSGEPMFPMFHAEAARTTHIILAPWKDNEEKYLFLGMVRTAFQHLRIKRYLLMTEAWLAPPIYKTTEEAIAAKNAAGGVQNIPGRREGLVVAYCEPGYRELRSMLTVREGAEDTSRAVDFKEDSRAVGEDKLSGDFFELLPDPKIPIDLRMERIIREFLAQFELKK